MKISKGVLALIVILAVIIADQALKIWVKTHFYLGEDFRIASWFQLLFIENDGMAFGMKMGSKLFLSLFRIVLAGALIWVIVKLKDRQDVKRGFLVCVALITAGAAGNIIDCLFYGLIFNNPMPPEVAVLFPDGGGYGAFLHGLVVDMLYFPLFSFQWPAWVPWVGGQEFLFFQPVFNLADAAITVGVLVMLIFYSKSLSEQMSDREPASASQDEE